MKGSWSMGCTFKCKKYQKHYCKSLRDIKLDLRRIMRTTVMLNNFYLICTESSRCTFMIKSHIFITQNTPINLPYLSCSDSHAVNRIYNFLEHHVTEKECFSLDRDLFPSNQSETLSSNFFSTAQ